VLGFSGGLDICDARWDDRGHEPNDPRRVNVAGEPLRPNHEVQGAVVGPAATALAELFRIRWRRACGEELALPVVEPSAAARFDLPTLTAGTGLTLTASEVFLSATSIGEDGEPVVQIRDVYTDAIRAAERLVYIETQYFTSRSIAAALVERLSDTSKPGLTLLVVLPRGADSHKERFALGEMQSEALGAIEEAGRAAGHHVYFLCSLCDETCATFVHSKVLLVDDELLSVASANFTERSMGIDSELALLWHADGNAELASEIGRVRASLLAEHAGREPSEFSSTEELAERVAALVLPGASRLNARHYEPVPANPLKTLIFDPGGPLSMSEAERVP
jgi:phosphatidylserine/phosphatidylglycerophosphate/cardiolipin synthase-like enzyme